MNNIALLAIIIMFMWLVAIGYYFYTSRQQNEISQELDELKEMLADESAQPKD